MINDIRMRRYSDTFIWEIHICAYLLQICRRTSTVIERSYMAEKIKRAARSVSERALVSELDLNNLDLYDQCLKELREIKR